MIKLIRPQKNLGKFSRINSIDLNILRIAVYEILFSEGIPAPIRLRKQ
ncbi:MAG: hypothetical protein Ct9H90mP22_9160 [Gammaproteobacteria bacterium]|nr:MAG: hypothetical protein Ct9H90mP22_9160 [Gammaproteobacteria bacterium]